MLSNNPKVETCYPIMQTPTPPPPATMLGAAPQYPPVDSGSPQVAVDGAVETLLCSSLLAGGQLAVQGRHVEQNGGLLEGDRALAAGQARQRVVPEAEGVGCQQVIPSARGSQSHTLQKRAKSTSQTCRESASHTFGGGVRVISCRRGRSPQVKPAVDG